MDRSNLPEVRNYFVTFLKTHLFKLAYYHVKYFSICVYLSDVDCNHCVLPSVFSVKRLIAINLD